METQSTNDNQEKLIRVAILSGKLMPTLLYHNIDHALDVYSSVLRLCHYENVNEEDKFLLQTAALLHDLVYIVNGKDNEEKSAKNTYDILSGLNYSNTQIKRVQELILATKWPTSPKNLLEQIICDADLDNLGRKDFFKKSKKLLLEWGVKKDNNWKKRQLDLLENNKYYTASAQKLRDAGKQENIKKLKELLGK